MPSPYLVLIIQFYLFQVGDRVCSTLGCSGTAAEYYACDEKGVLAIHDRFSFQDAAAIPASYCTAYRALVTRCKAKPGDSVLVHGASGGVSTKQIF